MWWLLFIGAASATTSVRSGSLSATVGTIQFRLPINPFETNAEATNIDTACATAADEDYPHDTEILSTLHSTHDLDDAHGCTWDADYIDIQAAGTTNQCEASHSRLSNAGVLSNAPLSSVASSGAAAGSMCVGTRCAAFTGSGCPAQTGEVTLVSPLTDWQGAPFNATNAEYAACCTTSHGQGCVGLECAYNCTSNFCGQLSVGVRSAKLCQGSSCGYKCEGESCAENCVGNSCGEECWFESCAKNCSGAFCGSTCSGASCAYNCSGTSCGSGCTGTSCASYCNSPSCGTSCVGSLCAAYCDNHLNANLPCGKYAEGESAAASCVGHGCGSYCVGTSCGQNASSSYTTAAIAGGVHDTPQEAVLCWNEYIGPSMWVLQNLYTIQFAPTAAPTSAPAGRRIREVPSDRERRVAYEPGLDASWDNSTCQIVNGPVVSTLSEVVIGPAGRCVGDGCAVNATGAFAGSFCVGTACARTAKGMFAGVACVGSQCAASAGRTTDYGAGAYCYGELCAVNSVGPWAGSYCIGNGCALGCTGQRCGTCCVGKNCSSNSTGLCADGAAFAVPMNMGAANELYSPACRSQIDTTSTYWTNFVTSCAAGHNETLLTVNFGSGCTLACSTELSRLLRYYQVRAQTHAYVMARSAASVRQLNVATRPSSKDDSLSGAEIALVVICSLIGAVVLVAVAVQVASVSGSSAGGNGFTALLKPIKP